MESGSTETNRKRLIFGTKIPPLATGRYRILQGDPLQIKNSARAENNILENEHLRIRFSADGNIGIFDKEAGREVFSGGATGCKAVVINDQSDTWSHDVKTFSDEIGALFRCKNKSS